MFVKRLAWQMIQVFKLSGVSTIDLIGSFLVTFFYIIVYIYQILLLFFTLAFVCYILCRKYLLSSKVTTQALSFNLDLSRYS